MNKKGQWARALARERRSSERRERVIETCHLKNKGYSVERIAVELGVGSETIRGYLREIDSDKIHYQSIVKQRSDQLREEEKEWIRKLTRTDGEIYSEEIVSSVKWAVILFCITLVIWWLPSLILYVATGGSVDITNWFYSWTGMPIFAIILFVIAYFSKVSEAKQKREKYNGQSKNNVHSSQTVRVVNSKMSLNCPKCTKTNQITMKELPSIGESVTYSCSECDANLDCTLPDKEYLCRGCKNKFRTILERRSHEENCAKLKQRTFHN